jgi:hypothetical protein
MKFFEKNVLCEKGDEITRFDGTFHTYLQNLFKTQGTEAYTSDIQHIAGVSAMLWLIHCPGRLRGRCGQLLPEKMAAKFVHNRGGAATKAADQIRKQFVDPDLELFGQVRIRERIRRIEHIFC